MSGKKLKIKLENHAAPDYCVICPASEYLSADHIEASERFGENKALAYAKLLNIKELSEIIKLKEKMDKKTITFFATYLDQTRIFKYFNPQKKYKRVFKKFIRNTLFLNPKNYLHTHFIFIDNNVPVGYLLLFKK